MKRFHVRAMDCCDLTPVDDLVDVCLHNMVEEYLVHPNNRFFAFFSLMEALRRTNESVRRTMNNISTSRPNLKKWPLVVAVEKNGGERAPVQRKNRIEAKQRC